MKARFQCTERITNIYIVLYALVLLFLLMAVNKSYLMGEGASYTLPTVSFFNDGNFVLSEADWLEGEQTMHSWAQAYKNTQHKISGVFDKNGEQLTWYFPVYSVFCVPFYGFCKLIDVSCEYAFRIANYTAFIILLFACNILCKFKPNTKLFIILAICFNPIIFMLKWASAETLIFCLLSGSILFWIHKRYNYAALFCAVAGMMNNTILFWGIVMILEYMVMLYLQNYKRESFLKIYLNRWKQIFLYALCYVPALLPMLYFWHYTGHITIQYFNTATIDKIYFGRFISYLFDLNLGMLPYFTVLLLLFFAFGIISLLKKGNHIYLCLFCGCIGTMLCYSLHHHLNCGMSGIARYNSWNSAFLCIGIPYYVEKNLCRDIYIKIVSCIISIGFVLSSIVLYFTWKHTDSDYTTFTPIAKVALDNIPGIYNPMPSTFNSRISHVDGGYNYECPIIYYDKKGFVRKILVTPETENTIRDCFWGDEKDVAWLNSKLDNVTKEQYISVGRSRSLRKYTSANSGDIIWLSGDQWNADEFINSGVSVNEDSFTWSDGNMMNFNTIHMEDSTENRNYILNISASSVFYCPQRVIVYCNGNEVFNHIITKEAELTIPIQVDENRMATITIILPDAISPKEVFGSTDERVLGLGLSKIVISNE